MSATFKTVKLEEPIVFENNGIKSSITELNIQKLKGKHLRFVPDEIFQGEVIANPCKYFELIASLTGLDVAQVEELEFDDLQNVITAVGALMGESNAPDQK
jgi:hypothetical protein